MEGVLSIGTENLLIPLEASILAIFFTIEAAFPARIPIRAPLFEVPLVRLPCDIRVPLQCMHMDLNMVQCGWYQHLHHE
jgi:hypothetical protein